MVTDERPYGDPTKPGRKDIDGVEWWACDPYPTWYRWENGELFTKWRPRWPPEEGVFDPETRYCLQPNACAQQNECRHPTLCPEREENGPEAPY